MCVCVLCNFLDLCECALPCLVAGLAPPWGFPTTHWPIISGGPPATTGVFEYLCLVWFPELSPLVKHCISYVLLGNKSLRNSVTPSHPHWWAHRSCGSLQTPLGRVLGCVYDTTSRSSELTRCTHPTALILSHCFGSSVLFPLHPELRKANQCRDKYLSVKCTRCDHQLWRMFKF